MDKTCFFAFGFIVFAFLKAFHVYFPKGLLEAEFSPLFSIVNGMVVFLVIYRIVDKSLEDNRLSFEKLMVKNNEITDLNKNLEAKVTARTQEINKKSKALERSNKELKRFSYIAAHDMREPLRNIIGFSQLLNRDILKKDFKKIAEYSSYINWSVWRIDAITRDIVDYTELEDRLTDVAMVDIATIISTTIDAQKEKRRDIIFNISNDNFPKISMNKTFSSDVISSAN
ncbi:MAG: hypothetical protein HC803_02135 [Saprospiraceae bacterium]|nr:hypothetical protein [Saprospiraceae bacterium]